MMMMAIQVLLSFTYNFITSLPWNNSTNSITNGPHAITSRTDTTGHFSSEFHLIAQQTNPHKITLLNKQKSHVNLLDGKQNLLQQTNIETSLIASPVNAASEDHAKENMRRVEPVTVDCGYAQELPQSNFASAEFIQNSAPTIPTNHDLRHRIVPTEVTDGKLDTASSNISPHLNKLNMQSSSNTTLHSDSILPIPHETMHQVNPTQIDTGKARDSLRLSLSKSTMLEEIEVIPMKQIFVNQIMPTQINSSKAQNDIQSDVTPTLRKANESSVTDLLYDYKNLRPIEQPTIDLARVYHIVGTGSAELESFAQRGIPNEVHTGLTGMQAELPPTLSDIPSIKKATADQIVHSQIIGEVVQVIQPSFLNNAIIGEAETLDGSPFITTINDETMLRIFPKNEVTIAPKENRSEVTLETIQKVFLSSTLNDDAEMVQRHENDSPSIVPINDVTMFKILSTDEVKLTENYCDAITEIIQQSFLNNTLIDDAEIVSKSIIPINNVTMFEIFPTDEVTPTENHSEAIIETIQQYFLNSALIEDADILPKHEYDYQFTTPVSHVTMFKASPTEEVKLTHDSYANVDIEEAVQTFFMNSSFIGDAEIVPEIKLNYPAITLINSVTMFKILPEDKAPLLQINANIEQAIQPSFQNSTLVGDNEIVPEFLFDSTSIAIINEVTPLQVSTTQVVHGEVDDEEAELNFVVKSFTVEQRSSTTSMDPSSTASIAKVVIYHVTPAHVASGKLEEPLEILTSGQVIVRTAENLSTSFIHSKPGSATSMESVNQIFTKLTNNHLSNQSLVSNDTAYFSAVDHSSILFRTALSHITHPDCLKNKITNRVSTSNHVPSAVNRFVKRLNEAPRSFSKIYPVDNVTKNSPILLRPSSTKKLPEETTTQTSSKAQIIDYANHATYKSFAECSLFRSALSQAGILKVAPKRLKSGTLLTSRWHSLLKSENDFDNSEGFISTKSLLIQVKTHRLSTQEMAVEMITNVQNSSIKDRQRVTGSSTAGHYPSDVQVESDDTLQKRSI